MATAIAKKRKIDGLPDDETPQSETLTLNPANGETLEDDLAPEPTQKLLESLSKEQLISLLTAAADRHADILVDVTRAVDADPVHRKIFVHGLGHETTLEALAAVFSQYGEIEESNVVTDKLTGKSKGYGFILFKSRAGARRALVSPQKKIGNRMSSCQMASAGPAGQPPPVVPPQSEYTQRKIYVSNVSSDLDPKKILEFFAKFGEIEEGPLGMDKQTGKPKGFALFVYKTSEGARKALEEPHKSFEGHVLHCQKAIDGPKPVKAAILPAYRGPAGPGPVGQVSQGFNPGFNPAFGQNMGLLAKPGQNLGFQMAPVQAGIPGQYMPVQGNLNAGVMGTYGGQVPVTVPVQMPVQVPGVYGNPAVNLGAGRGNVVLAPRGGVGAYRPS